MNWGGVWEQGLEDPIRKMGQREKWKPNVELEIISHRRKRKRASDAGRWGRWSRF
jgi:putative SOS response-associated peptidase YedK